MLSECDDRLRAQEIDLARQERTAAALVFAVSAGRKVVGVTTRLPVAHERVREQAALRIDLCSVQAGENPSPGWLREPLLSGDDARIEVRESPKVVADHQDVRDASACTGMHEAVAAREERRARNPAHTGTQYVGQRTERGQV